VGHELWIDTSEFKVEKGTKVDFDLRNGENFDGFSLGYFDRSVEKLYWRQNGERFDNASRQGDIPALQIEPDKNGLISAIYVSKPSVIKYKDFKKFHSFAIEKDAQDAVDLHLSQSFPMENFSEIYTRYSKALVGVGSSIGSDQANNLELELIAKENPYTDDMSDGIEILLLYNGQPHAFATLNVFERSTIDFGVNTFAVQTNKKGMATVKVKNDRTYLIDNVILRPASVKLSKDKGVIWESLWAALTFGVIKANGL
tara:strand:- start:2108 stop:2878 length:771 start_codon:yes stop_codon:yes gene_type:complete